MNWWNRPVALADLPALWPGDTVTLVDTGIVTTEHLTRRVQNDDGVERLSQETAIPLEVLSDYNLIAEHEERKRDIRRQFGLLSLVVLPLLGVSGWGYALSQNPFPTDCELAYGTLLEESEVSATIGSVERVLNGVCAEGEPGVEPWMRDNLEQLAASLREEEALMALQELDFDTLQSALDEAKDIYAGLRDSSSHEELSRLNQFKFSVRQLSAIDEAESVVSNDETETLQSLELLKAQAILVAQESVAHVYGTSLEAFDEEFRETLASFQQAQTAQLNRLNARTNDQLASQRRVLEAEIETQRVMFNEVLELQQGRLDQIALELRQQQGQLDQNALELEQLREQLEPRLAGLAAANREIVANFSSLESTHARDASRLDDVEATQAEILELLEATRTGVAQSANVTVSSSDCRVVSLREVRAALLAGVRQDGAPMLAPDATVGVNIQFDRDGDITIKPDATAAEAAENEVDDYVIDVLTEYFRELQRETQEPTCQIRVVYAHAGDRPDG